MQNKLTDLNNHLFEQMERLNDENLTGEQLQTEIVRAKAMADLGQTIIKNGELALKVVKQAYEQGTEMRVPEMLGGGERGPKKISAGRS